MYKKLVRQHNESLNLLFPKVDEHQKRKFG